MYMYDKSRQTNITQKRPSSNQPCISVLVGDIFKIEMEHIVFAIFFVCNQLKKPYKKNLTLESKNDMKKK